jgi:hypothetical protein
MSYQVDSYGNAYFPAGVSVASIPITTGTQAKVLVPGVNGRISSATVAQLITQSGGNLVSSVFGRTGVVTAQAGDYNSDQVQEGRYALYFSISRVRKSIDLTTFNTSGPATYDSFTGILNIPQYGSGSGGNYVPLTRKITINSQTADLSVDRIFSVKEMVYPAAGIALSTGTAWDTSIVNNSANWNTAYTDRMKWDGGATGLVAATGRASLGLVIGTDVLAYRTFGTAANSASTDFALAVHTHTIANVTGLQTALDGKEPSIAAGTTAQYWRGDKTFQTLPIYSLPTASTTILGGVKVDGVTITIDANGVISGANTYVLPTATSTILGGVKIGAGVTITSGVISVSTNYEAPITAGTTLQYFRGDKTFQTLPIYTLAGLGGLPLAGGIMTGAITLKEGAANGLKFPNDVFGGSGDTAGMRLIARSGEAMSLEVYLTNDADDWFNIVVPSDNGAKVNGNTIWHAGNLTNLNQLTNGPGYITSYTETDTLASVTNRGSSTSQNITFSNGRKGLIGVYDAAQTQAIFAMGAAYILTDGGASATIGNLYGLAWSYNPDYGGAGNNPQSKAGLNHQLLLMQNGVTTAAMGSGIWTSGNVTASTFIGSIAWTSVTSRPTALSQFTNDLGNYGGWYSSSGGTISGDVTINGVSNIPLTINQVQPYLHLNATGATNTAGVRIYPSAGYDAYIGNFNGGALNLVASGVTVAKVTSNAGVIFYTSTTGPITSVGSNTSASMVFINGDSSNKTWDISMYANDWILNESNITTRFKVLSGGGVYADAYYEFSDKRFKTLIEENPNIINVGSITAKSYIKEGKEELGYFAQDFEGVLDSAILKDKDGVLSLSYRQIHTAKIAALEKRIAELEAKLK